MSGVGSRSGALAGGGGVPVAVVGNQTPGDNIVTPSDALDTRTFVELFDPTGGNWDAWRMTSVQGAGDVTERLAPAAEDNTNSVYWVQNRAVATSTGAWTRTSPTALIGTAGVNLKNSAGRIRRIRATNTGAAAWYLQVHDDAAAPVNTDNSVDRIIVPAGLTVGIEYGPEGMLLPTGVSYALSVTVVALTLLAALEGAVEVEWL